jgi:predicted permease
MFGKRRGQEDFDAEVRAHIELEKDRLREDGCTQDEARAAARRAFGSRALAGERFYESRRWMWLERLGSDLKYTLRTMARTPGFAAAIVLTLALGVGANTAIFSVVNSILLRPLPYAQPDQLVVILHDGSNPVAPANYIDWRNQSDVFESMGAAEAWSPNLTAVDRAEKVEGLHITSDILPMLGVEPMIGRVFLPEEDEVGREHEAVLSYRLWQRRFSGKPSAIGQPIILDGETYTIIGVMPPGFKFAPFWATKAELWAPLALGDRVGRELGYPTKIRLSAPSRHGNSLRVFARLKPGASLDQARAEMAAITARLEKEYPGTNRNVVVESLKEKVVGGIRPALLLLLGAVGFVLLIACANVAHMLLARAATRQKEIAVRAALGATRGRLIQQFLTESLLLAFLGGGAGLLLAMWMLRILVALGPSKIPRLETVGLDGRVLAFMLIVSILTGVACGIAPGLRGSALDCGESLKDGGRGASDGASGSGLRSLLVGSEFALALVLLVGAALMIRSFIALQSVDPGFNPHNLQTMVVSVTGSEQSDRARRVGFYQQLIRQMEALPGVKSVSAINHLPLAGDLWYQSVWIDGRPIPPHGEEQGAVYRSVLPNYFRTMNIPVLRGRDFTESDNLKVPDEVIVNQRLAGEFWPGEDPIGKRITIDDPHNNPSWITVVGVVKDATQDDWTALPRSEVYLPFLQSGNYLENPSSHFSYLTLVVRTTVDPAAVAPAMLGVVSSLDSNVPVSEIQTMDEVVAGATAQPRFYLVVLVMFAAVAVIMAAGGIYGVMSYSVSRRTHEIGIRRSLGATPRDVFALVVRHAMAVALAGAGVGLLGALALTHLMSSLLFGVRPVDPLTFVGVPVLLCAVALMASYIPARRATRIDPMSALRCE